MYELIRVLDLFLIGINPVSFARQGKFATVFGMSSSGKRCGRHVSWLAAPASAAFFGSPAFFRLCCDLLLGVLFRCSTRVHAWWHTGSRADQI